uniref:Putative 4-coumarate--CoA ligase 3 n=1 Tax=Ceratitis capitata TaxID=7213 RepID=W8AES8_CERCA
MNYDTKFDSEKRIWSNVAPDRLFNPDKSIGGVALHMLRAQPPNAICQICDSEETELTYSKAYSYAVSVAAHLKGLGLGCDDVAGIVAYNTTLLMPVIVGCWVNGVAVNTMHPIYEEDVIRELFQVTKPKIIFCDGVCYEKVRDATKMLNVPIYTLCNHFDGVKKVEEILIPVEGESMYGAEPLKHGANQTMAILPSSGTTGVPKLVCNSNHKLLVDFCLSNGSSVIFTFATAQWNTGISLMVVNILCGGTRIVTTKSYSPEYFLELIVKYKISMIFSSPVLVGALVDLPQCTQESLASIRILVITGGNATRSMQKRIRDKLTNGYLLNSYGTTEIGAISVNYSQEKAESVGRINIGSYVKVIDPVSGNLLGPNEKGEIWARVTGDWMGFYGNAAATAEMIDADGFINTGDIGYIDDECYMYLVDRSKDIMKYYNFHFSPTEIETTISLLPDVLDVCVFGVSDGNGMDLAAAAVVLKTGSTLTEDDIVKFVAEKNKVKHKQLNYGAFIVAEIARNVNSKVMRAEMKQICLNMESSKKRKI